MCIWQESGPTVSRRRVILGPIACLDDARRQAPAYLGIEAIPRQECVRALTPLPWVSDPGQGPSVPGEQALGRDLIR